jgi:hypothetical protein
MDMSVVNIGEMRVRVGNRGVLMGMRTRFLSVPLKIVRVLMVRMRLTSAVLRAAVNGGNLVPTKCFDGNQSGRDCG